MINNIYDESWEEVLKQREYIKKVKVSFNILIVFRNLKKLWRLERKLKKRESQRSGMPLPIGREVTTCRWSTVSSNSKSS